jgi:hypothetical protein
MEIDNKLLMAQLWQATNRDDSIFKEIRQLMQKKRELSESYENCNAQLNYKRRQTDAMLDKAFGSHVARRGRSSLSNNTTRDDTSIAMTRASSAPPPTSFVDVPCSHQTNEAATPSPDNDVQPPDNYVPRSQTNKATIQQSPDDADSTYDLRDYVDPALILCPPPKYASKNLGSISFTTTVVISTNSCKCSH